MKSKLLAISLLLSMSANAQVIYPQQYSYLDKSELAVAQHVYSDIKKFEKSIFNVIKNNLNRYQNNKMPSITPVGGKVKELQLLVLQARHLTLLDQSAIEKSANDLMDAMQMSGQDFFTFDFNKALLEGSDDNHDMAAIYIALIKLNETLKQEYKKYYPQKVKYKLEF